MLTLMIDKLIERKQDMVKPHQATSTDAELFQKAGVKVKKVKREH